VLEAATALMFCTISQGCDFELPPGLCRKMVVERADTALVLSSAGDDNYYKFCFIAACSAWVLPLGSFLPVADRPVC
jgi:hypothetical protein